MNFSLISAINIGANSNRTCINMWLNKQNVAICKYLFYKGLIDTYVISKEKRLLHIYFSFFYEKKPILFIKQLSKPGRRLSMKYSKLASLFKNRKHLYIISTSRGFMTSTEAIRNKIGGELLFIIRC